jgi:membrane carboxypeptidase/penicillin-binding protein PbpC
VVAGLVCLLAAWSVWHQVGHSGGDAHIPAWKPGCGDNASAVLQIEGVRDGDILRRAPQGGPPVLQLSVRGAQANVHWLVDGRQFGLTAANGRQALTLDSPGAVDITAVDEGGRFGHARVTVAN